MNIPITVFSTKPQLTVHKPAGVNVISNLQAQQIPKTKQQQLGQDENTVCSGKKNSFKITQFKQIFG